MDNDAAVHTTDYLWWIDQINSPSGDVWLAGELAAGGDWISANAVLGNIISEYGLIGSQADDITYIQGIYNLISQSDLYNLSVHQLNQLKVIAAMNHGDAPVMANSILNIYGEALPVRYSLEEVGQPKPRIANNQQTAATTYQVSIYPNPARNEITIDWEDETIQCINFELYNQHGLIMISAKLNKKSNLDVSILPNGIYYYKIAQLNNTIGKLLILK
jgi:hypothetical protein